MSLSQFQQSFRGFDPKTVNAAMIARLKPYVQDASCAPEEIRKVSRAMESIAMWVHAVYDYGCQ